MSLKLNHSLTNEFPESFLMDLWEKVFKVQDIKESDIFHNFCSCLSWEEIKIVLSQMHTMFVSRFKTFVLLFLFYFFYVFLQYFKSCDFMAFFNCYVMSPLTSEVLKSQQLTICHIFQWGRMCFFCCLTEGLGITELHRLPYINYLNLLWYLIINYIFYLYYLLDLNF